MKPNLARAICFLFITITLVTARFSLNGVLLFADGEYSYFTYSDEQIYIDDPLFNAIGRYERVDFLGDERDVIEVLEKAKAVVKKRERIGNIEIIYAFSPLLMTFKTTDNGTVNLMVAVRNGVISIGSPLLKGSY